MLAQQMQVIQEIMVLVVLQEILEIMV